MIGLSRLEVEAGGFRVGPLDLAIDDGAYAVLLGPSGAGKSLVLEGLAGVRPLRAGAVLVDGEDVSALTPERRRVGLVFQEGLLFPHLSVAANIAYGLRDEGGGRVSRRAGAAAVAELAAAVGAGRLLERRPATLSGGERQRVALARALAARPRALLLDEPLSAVDAEAREELQEVLRSLSSRRGLTVLHVTHDRAEAFALADVCALLIGGRLRQVGSPRDVLRAPADEAVARLLGARNVLRASRDPGDVLRARTASGLSLAVASALPEGAFDLVIRPEDIEVRLARREEPAARDGSAGRDLSPGREQPEVQLIAATVARLVLQGGHVLVGTEAPEPLDALLSRRRADELDLRIGTPVRLAVDAAHVHVIPVA